MNSPGASSSPKYKNINFMRNQSPIELKEKMRKSYKNKVQNCREMLLDRFRGSVAGKDLYNTLADIYKSMFNHSGAMEIDKEMQVMDELENELVQEELEWWLKENEKLQMDNVDWSSMEQEDNVICPVCQKTNLKSENHVVSCSDCIFAIKTEKSLLEIKNSIFSCIEKHNAVCNNEVQFTVMPDCNYAQICVICETCAVINTVI